MFSIDHPVVSGLNKITDIIILNVLVVILSIPIVTIGAAWTAMYYVTLKMVRNEESYILRDFFKSFKQNFFQSTIIWLINLVIIFLFVVDVRILSISSENISRASIVLIVLMAFFLMAFITNVYPMQAHYVNTIPRTIKNGILIALGNLPHTALFIFVTLLPFAILLTNMGLYLSPIILLIGFSGPAYICSKSWRKIFARLDPEEKVESVDGTEEGLNTTE